MPKKSQIMYLDVFFNSEKTKHDENKSKPILDEGKIGLYHELLKINVFNKYDELKSRIWRNFDKFPEISVNFSLNIAKYLISAKFITRRW